MKHEKKTFQYLLGFLVVLALVLVFPAAAQGTAPRVVQSGETIEVGSEPLVLELINLRNADTQNPVTELRHYRNDDPTRQIVQVIAVPNDGYFTVNTHTLGGKYGRYYAYSAKDGLLKQHSITFAAAPTMTPTDSSTTATGTPAETPATTATATTTTTSTQAPFPGVIAIAAIAIYGLLAATHKR